MFAQAQEEHQWLAQLAGNWTFESECAAGPDPAQPPMKSTGKVVARTLGGLWVLLEGEGDTPDGQMCQSIITLGYDATAQKFVGSFIASVMGQLWIYSGTRDAAKRVLVLDTVGPKFDGPGTANYQDIFEMIDQDHWTLSSQVQGDDGNWTKFMTAHYHRVK